MAKTQICSGAPEFALVLDASLAATVSGSCSLNNYNNDTGVLPPTHAAVFADSGDIPASITIVDVQFGFKIGSGGGDAFTAVLTVNGSSGGVISGSSSMGPYATNPATGLAWTRAELFTAAFSEASTITAGAPVLRGMSMRVQYTIPSSPTVTISQLPLELIYDYALLQLSEAAGDAAAGWGASPSALGGGVGTGGSGTGGGVAGCFGALDPPTGSPSGTKGGPI